MTEPDLDDVAFLTGTGAGDSTSGRPTRDGVAVCSQKRALCVTAIVLATLLGTALVIAYAGPQNDCACAGKMPPGYTPENYNSSEPFNPIATNGQPFPWLSPNLPANVRPNRYVLTIHPNLTNLDVKGQVTIEFHVEKDTNFIVLHIQDLNITEKAIIGPKGYALKISKLLEFPPRQQLYIEIKDKLRKKVNYTLNLRWYSRLVPEPEGFYVDTYEGVNGIKRFLAATVFKPSGARKAFPCFDEPHLRAPFRISVFRDRFHIGLSNSIVHATDDVGFYMGTGLLRDDFYETPPLPPDAIAWVVSDFQRETVEPSLTYQTPSTAAPIILSSRAPTDNLAFRTDKRPIKNKTALMTKALHIMTPVNGTGSATTTSLSATASNGLVVDSVTTNGRNISGNATDGDGIQEIRTAPSYTFYASRNLLSRGRFVLLTSRDVLEYLQTWLGVAYPLTKLDFVALPSLELDLTSSLGLITVRSSFLRDQDTIKTEDYHMAAIKVAETIVKQFFGGITSPKIWKHTWLWEGLIKYLGRFVLSPLQPKWPLDELLLMHVTMKALDIDAIEGWEGLVDGTSDNGINDAFYIDKSAALLAMLNAALGEDNFRGCLGIFLNTHKFQTAEPIDLWNACSKQMNSTRNIKEMMHLWTTLPGFPLVTVTKVGSSVTISQKSFEPAEFKAILDEFAFSNITATSVATTTTTTTTQAPKGDVKKKQPTRWIFPVNYITNVENASDTIWLQSTDTSFTMQVEAKWMKVNTGQNGYYRVLYDEDNWANLIEELKTDHELFSSKDRIGLLSDAFTLCHANLMPCQITMSLISYLPKEKDWGPMTTGLRHLEQWRRILKYSECFLMLAEFVRSILGRSLIELGWQNDGNDSVKLLRPEVLLASVLWEDPDAIKQSKMMVHANLINGTVIPANLREVVYTGAVLSGEFLYWKHCWDRFNELRLQSEGFAERMELLRALGETKDAWLQNRLLSHVITLPPAELVQVLEAIAGTPTGGAMACRFLQAKWFDLQTKLGRGSVQFARVISAITQYGATKFDYDELKSLVERFGYGPGMRVLNMTLKSVAANVEWVSRTQIEFSNWLVSLDTMH